MSSQNSGPKARLRNVLRTPKRWPVFQQWALAIMDLVIITISCLLAVSFRTVLPFFSAVEDLQDVVVPLAPIFVVGWQTLLVIGGAYNKKYLGYGVMEYRRVLTASILAATSLGVGCYLTKFHLSRGFYALFFVVGTALLLLGHFVARKLVHLVRKRNLAVIPVVIGGDDEHVADMALRLQRESWLGYRIRGALLPDGVGEKVSELGIEILGTPDDCLDAVETTDAEAVIFTEGAFPTGRDFNVVARDLENRSARLIVAPALTDISSFRMELRPVAGIPLMHIESPRALEAGRWKKRLFDIVGSSLLLLIFAPVMIVTALLIKLDDRGPVFFKQMRAGLKGEPFGMLKFRSMCVNAEELKAQLLAENESDGGVLFKMENDPRITKIGKFIRRFSIDELPQFINVLTGDMSLVGPRPALFSEVELYEDEMLRRLDVRPGVTGQWQVSGRSDLPWDEAVRLDVGYVDNWSMMQDLVILFRTPAAVLASRGAY